MSPFERDTRQHVDPPDAPRADSATSGSSSDADESAAHIAELVRRSTERAALPGPSSYAVTEKTVEQPPLTASPATERFAQPVSQPAGQPVTQRMAQPGAPRTAQPVTSQPQQPATQRMAQPGAQGTAQPVTGQPQQPATQRMAQPGAQGTAQPVNGQPQQPVTRQPEQQGAGHAGRRGLPWALPAELRRPPLWVLAAGGAVAAVLIASGFALSQSGSPAVTPAATPRAATAAPPAYVVKVKDQITDCASHSHGKTKTSFESHNCVTATRSLATGLVSGRSVLYVTSRIEMASAEEAASLRQVLDASGTGNLNDLLREGKTFDGAPRVMPRSGYASAQKGTVIVVAEAGFIDGGTSSNTNPALRAAAALIARR